MTLKVLKFEKDDLKVNVKVPFLNTQSDFETLMVLCDLLEEKGQSFSISYRDFLKRRYPNAKSFDEKNTAATKASLDKISTIHLFSQNKDDFETDHAFKNLCKTGDTLHVQFADFFYQLMLESNPFYKFDREEFRSLKTTYAKSLLLLLAGSDTNVFTKADLVKRIGLGQYENSKQNQILNGAINELKSKGIIKVSVSLNEKGRAEFITIDKRPKDPFTIVNPSVFVEPVEAPTSNPDASEMHSDGSYSEKWLPAPVVVPVAAKMVDSVNDIDNPITTSTERPKVCSYELIETVKHDFKPKKPENSPKLFDEPAKVKRKSIFKYSI
ncbi:TPA: hypothetical protein ACXK4S_000666 [Pseudomonas aeruginosa]